MPISFENLIAGVVFAFIVMASWCPCAVGQQESGLDAGRPERASSISSMNPLRPTLLPDLRTDRIEPKVEWLEPLPADPAVSPPTELLPPHVAEQPAENLERSFFDHDQPPVVLVWMNSDLHNALVSEGQLKQWMHSAASQDDLERATRIGTWQADSEARVQSASFSVAMPEGPAVFTRSEEQINEFVNRLKKIREQYEIKKKQLADESGEDDGSQEELNNLLKQTGDWIGRADSGLEELKDKTNKKAGFDKELTKQEESLAAEKKEAENPKPPIEYEELDQLQKKLKEEQAELQASIELRSEIRDQISDRDKRVTELPGLLRENAKDENETKNLINELKSKAEDELSRSFKQLLLDAHLLSLEITEESLELESVRQEQIGRILPLQLEELTLKINRMNAELVILGKLSDELRDQEIKEIQIAAEKALNEELTQSTPVLKELAEFNKDLASQQTSLAKKSDELESELINVRKLQDELDESHKRIKDQISKLGPTASGIRLVEHRRSLISTGKSQNRLLDLAERLHSKQTRKLLLKERLDQLALGASFKSEVIASVKEQLPENEQGMGFVVADQLLKTQKEYAADLVKVLSDNIQKLADLESAHKTLIDKVQEVKAFSDENALWVRSAKPIELDDIKRCQAGLRSVLVSEQWGKLTKQAYANFGKHPYHAGLLALVIGSLLVVRRRLRWSHE